MLRALLSVGCVVSFVRAKRERDFSGRVVVCMRQNLRSDNPLSRTLAEVLRTFVSNYVAPFI